MKASSVNLMLKTAQETFWNSYVAMPDPFAGLLYRRPSSQKIDTFARLGAAPLPTAWVGSRNAQDPGEFSYTVTNNNYDATVRIDKDLVRYQQFDAIGRLVANLGEKAAGLIPSLATTLLLSGGNGDDGIAFFSTAHKDPGAVYQTSQDNARTGAAATGTNPTAAEARTALKDSFSQILSYKDDRGDPFSPTEVNPAEMIVLIPPSFWAAYNQNLVADTISSAGDNDLKGMFTLRVNPYISADRHFFCYAGMNHKPLIINEAGGVETNSQIEYGTGDYLYSASWSGVAAYGNWRTIIQYLYT